MVVSGKNPEADISIMSPAKTPEQILSIHYPDHAAFFLAATFDSQAAVLISEPCFTA